MVVSREIVIITHKTEIIIHWKNQIEIRLKGPDHNHTADTTIHEDQVRTTMLRPRYVHGPLRP